MSIDAMSLALGWAIGMVMGIIIMLILLIMASLKGRALIMLKRRGP